MSRQGTHEAAEGAAAQLGEPEDTQTADPTVEIWLNEEKGSDVSLATQLLLDAFDGNFDLAVVISNDSDLAWPILKLRTKFKKNVGVYKPVSPAGSRARSRGVTRRN